MDEWLWDSGAFTSASSHQRICSSTIVIDLSSVFLGLKIIVAAAFVTELRLKVPARQVCPDVGSLPVIKPVHTIIQCEKLVGIQLDEVLQPTHLAILNEVKFGLKVLYNLLGLSQQRNA